MKYSLSLIVILMSSSCVQKTQEQSNETSSTTEKTEQIKTDGIAISAQLQQTLGSHLKKAIEDSGIVYALQYCNLNAYPLTDSMEALHGVKIRRVSHKSRNPLNKADERELAIIHDFKSKTDEGEAAHPVIIEQTDSYAFFAPIMIQAPLCLRCHGNPGTDILPEDFIAINMLYPNDEATGFTLNELRGMWRIDFNKNQKAL